MPKHHILFIGYGQMAKAISTGLKKSDNIVQPVYFLNRSQKSCQKEATQLSITEAQNKKFSIAILATKPQNMETVMLQYQHILTKVPLILTVAAGKNCAFYEKYLHTKQALIRVMPNTPAEIGKAVSVCYANAHATKNDRQVTHDIFSSIGSCYFVKDENDMHNATAVSGSGSAYVFAFIEALYAAAVQIGLEKELAMALAKDTVRGAGLLAQKSDKEPHELRKNVTSPKGTTEAGLVHLLHDENGLHSLLEKTLRAAKKRSIELSQ